VRELKNTRLLQCQCKSWWP